MNYRELIETVSEAMLDCMDGDPRPHNPAIMIDRNTGEPYYGSAIHAQIGDTVLAKIEGNWFGSWWPETEEDIPVAASGYATVLLEEMDI